MRTVLVSILAGALLLAAGCNTPPATPPGGMAPGVAPAPGGSGSAAAQTHYEQGVDLVKKGDISNAKEAFNTAIRLDTSYAPAYLGLANIAVHSGDINEAITQLETLQRAAPQTPHLLCRLAELRATTGSFVDGTAAAQLAHEREPDCPRADMQYGLMLVGTGDLKGAATFLEKAHKEEPENPRITLELARLRARNGQPEDAWKLLDSLPNPSVQPVQEYAFRARLLSEVGRDGKRDDKQALALLGQALAIAPDDGTSNLEKGKILLRTGDAAGAFTCLQKAAKASPPSAELLTALAQAGTRLNKPGAAQMEQGAQKFSAVVSDLYAARRAYLADPNSRTNRLRLARLEAAIGNGPDAQILLTRILKDNPNDTEALQLMAAGNKQP